MLLARKAPQLQQVDDPQRRDTQSARRLSASTSTSSRRYNPWDQRMCLMLDNDLYKAISDGRVDVVTDHIDHIDADRHRAAVRSAHRCRRDRHRHRPAVAGARRCRAQHRRRGGQAAGPVRLQGAHARGRPERGVVRRLHQRVVDAAGRPDRAGGGKAVGLHGLSRLHPRLPASRRRADAGEAGVEHQRRATCSAPRTRCRSRARTGRGTCGTTTCCDAIDHRFDRIEESMVFGRAATASAGSAPSRATA